MNYIAELFNNPYFNAIFTGFIVLLTVNITNLGHPLIGVILSTFPVGIMSLLSITNLKLRDDFLSHVIVGNVIIAIMWVIIFNFKQYDNDTLAIIGFSSWFFMGFLYFLYLKFTNS